MFEGISKLFEEGWKVAKDIFYYLIGIGSEAAKGARTKPAKGLNWQGYLYVYPFLIIAIIVVWLIVRPFIWK